MLWICLRLLLLYALYDGHGVGAFVYDSEFMFNNPVSPKHDRALNRGEEKLNVASIHPQGDKETSVQLSAEISSSQRKLLQTDEDAEDDASDFECSLTDIQVEEHLNASTRTWLIDDDALDDLDDDLQAVVNCTEEGDVILLNVSERIIPSSRIVLPWTLTVSGLVEDTELKDGVFPATSSRSTISCPDENEGIFLIRQDSTMNYRKIIQSLFRSRSVLFANIFFENCSFDVSTELKGIIEVQECESESVTDTVRLHHIGFTNNRLIGGVGLFMNSPSCSATELIDVEFRDNICKGFCGAVMSSDNTLEDVVIERNTHFGDADDIPAVLFAPEGSETTANDIIARSNEATMIFINNGSLRLTDSSFRENSADVTRKDDPFASCLHVVNSLIEIEDCEFVSNKADLGGVMYSNGSFIDVVDCIFNDNTADDGAVFYAVRESQIEVSESIFTGNAAKDIGGVLYANDSEVTVIDSMFDRNLAVYAGGCFGFTNLGALSLKRSNFSRNEGVFGGVAFFKNEGQCVVRECTFNKNNAVTSGGVLYMERSNSTIEYCHAALGNGTFGGVFFSIESLLRIRHFSCEENKASYGGCLFARSASRIEMINVSIVVNRALEDGGGMYALTNSVIIAQQLNLTSNSASNKGGGIHLDSSRLLLQKAYIMSNSGIRGSGISAYNGTKVNSTRVHFERNRGTFGAAALLTGDGDGNFTSCSFLNNEAETSAGSIYIELSKVNIEDCQFRGGNAKVGGLIFSTESRVATYNTSFTEAMSSTSGGCLLVNDGGFFAMQNVSLTSCESENGGAVYVFNSTMIARNCTLSSSRANDGASIRSDGSRLSIEDVVIKDGNATNIGGIYSTKNGTVEIRNCHFSNNVARNGGALNLDAGSVGNISRCSFIKNVAEASGGAVYLEDANATIRACKFEKNTATNGGSLTVSHGSRLKFEDSVCIESNGKNGGCMQCFTESYVEARNISFENNKVTVHGGGIDGRMQCQLLVSNSIFNRNSALEDGGAMRVIQSVLEAHNLTIVNNSAAVNGGGLYCKQSVSVILTESDITKNSAQWGGGVVIFNVKISIFRRLKMSKNSAGRTGGSMYLQHTSSTIQELEWSKNRALYGGTLDTRDASVNITTSTCSDSLTINDGGAIYAVNSTIHMSNVLINRATAGKGGGAMYLLNTHLTAIDLAASDCRSQEDGGIALVKATSTLLCSNCILKNSVATARGGAISIDSNLTGQLVAQFQDGVILNNTAEFGGTVFTLSMSPKACVSSGGLHFISPYQNVDCSLKGAECTYVALRGTRLEMNTASYAGGAIFTTDLSTIRIDCSDEKYEDGNLTFYKRRQWESMNVIKSEDDLCPSWKNNSAQTYGGGIGTYATLVNTKIYDKSKTVVVNSSAEPYVIQNHASGKPLPDVELKIVDALGQGPAIGVKNSTVMATMSSNDFLSGMISKPLEDGSRNFSKITGFQVPGTYDIVIDFSEESLKPVRFKVQIRRCRVGERATSNKLFCDKCTAATYSFDPEGNSGCLPCPSNGNCASITIRPDNGYWNQFPCSEHVQRCLTKRACDYNGRDEILTTFGKDGTDGDIQSCEFENATANNYATALCRPGHKGPLCGSCEENYGKSQSFNCEECFTGFGNVVLVFFSVMVLTGLAGFTTRSNLVSFGRMVLQRRTENDGMPGTSSGPPAENMDLEMMEQYYLGKASGHGETDSGIGRINVRERAARKAEMSKWEAVELFKITVNFVQITAIAIAINVEWSVLLIGMFEAAEFASGITSEATNRSVDCLVSEDSSIPRSIISTIIDLLVPAAVVGLFVLFWTIITLRKKQDWSYLFKRSALSALAVFYISYISITKTLVNILSCIKVHDSTTVMVDHTSDYWAVDTSLKCYEASHALLTGIAGWPLLFLFSLLFPIAVAMLIVYNVKRDYEDGWIYDIAGFMYRGYGRKYVFWESVIMLRKAVLAVIVVFAYPLESSMQAVLAVFVLAFSLYLQMICHPFRKEFKSLNEMEGLSLLVSLLTFVSSMCFDNEHVPFGARVAITIAVFLCNIGLFFFFVTFFFIFSAEHLKAVLDREGVHYRRDGGTVHILHVYFFVHLSGTILRGFGRCFKCLVGPRFYDRSPA